MYVCAWIGGPCLGGLSPNADDDDDDDDDDEKHLPLPISIHADDVVRRRRFASRETAQ